MKKKVKKFEYDTRFHIPQIPKIHGLRGVSKYERDAFVSPIFGSDVKDEVTVPFEIRIFGDKVKRYDAFRTKPQLNKEKEKELYGRSYSEFDSVVDKDTRVKTFGVSGYKIKEQKIEEPMLSEKTSRPVENVAAQGASMYVSSDDASFDTHKPSWLTPTAYQGEPEDADMDVDIETFQRTPQTESVKIKTGFDQLTPEENETETLEKKPQLQRQKYQLPAVDTYQKTMRDPEAKPPWLLEQIEVINRTLQDHAVDGEVRGSKKGPTVTRYEIALKPGVNVKRVIAIQDNLMMNLAAKSLRIEAPIPGKPYVGIEVANKVAEIVSFGNVVDRKAFLDDHENPLKVALGEDIDGTNIYVDIAKMPHGLIAGATNSGKSVCVNTILISLLLKNKPEDLKLILIDPKMVELTPYNDLPHLITPVITDAKMASTALQWAVDEMERRYRMFASSRSRDMKSFNENVKRGLIDEEKMPYIVIIIDELADLMMVAPHDVEDAIQRITQKARAAGIHLLVATQRPTTDVVKGTIKSNIPTRIAFKVASFVDSTTILDGAGAETLLGRGDMLLKEGDRAVRIQGAYISNQEIDDTIDFIKQQRKPNYIFKHEELKRKMEYKEEVDDDLFEDVAYYVVREQNASINAIQKEFEIGFNRAQKLVTLLEQREIVSPSQGTKAREVLVTFDELNDILG